MMDRQHLRAHLRTCRRRRHDGVLAEQERPGAHQGRDAERRCLRARRVLGGYNPFKDLATATCKQVAEYVTAVIKKANSSGAAMNAMLKGQCWPRPWTSTSALRATW